MARKSHKQFLSDLARANPSVKPIGVYVHSTEPIEVECRVCGNQWTQTPNMLLRKSGCPECARKHLGDARRKTNEQFVAELEQANPNAVPLDAYVNCTTPLNVRCRACGTIWKSTPTSLLKGVLCPRCRHERKMAIRRKSNDDFLEDMSTKHPNIQVLGSYQGSKVGIPCKCMKCGFKWFPRPNDLMDGHGCPKCGGSHRKTHGEYVAELQKKFPNLEVTSRYISDSKRVRVRCRVCGHERDAIANSLLRQNEGGANCPNCAGTRRLTDEEFRARLAEANPQIVAIGEYRNMNTGIEVECKLCGYRWHPTPASIAHMKSGCPRCHHGTTSVMEQFLYHAFSHMLGSDAVLSRDRSLGIELDVYVPKLKLAIEPGSWFWHEAKLGADGDKRVLCSSNRIRLITIYDQCPLSEPPFDEDCMVFDYALATEKGMETLKSIVVGILEDYGIDAACSEGDWNAISRKARLSSRRMTTDEFRERLAAISPSVELLNDYVGSKTRMHCRCKDCGNEWQTAAGNLLYQKTRCPRCSHKKRT